MLCRPVEPDKMDRYVCDDDWLAQQKLDGQRVLASVVDGDVKAYGRDGSRRANGIPAGVSRGLARLAHGTWWLDGELLGDVLWLFDLPAAMVSARPENPSVRLEHPFEERYFVLHQLMKDYWRPGPHIRLLPVAEGIDEKVALVRDVYLSEAEGVIFRHRDGCYAPGVRAERTLKAKFTNTVDAVVTALRVEGKDNCAVAVFDGNGTEVDVGRCKLEGKPPVAVGDVIEVKYLYAATPSKPRLVQPRLLRVRDDKPATECTLDQLRFTDKSVQAEWLR